jgi:MFS family permease
MVEKLGRKPTLTIALCGGGVAHLLFWAQDTFGLSTTIPVVALFLYMFAFGVGIGPVVWIVIPELFEDEVRSLFMSVIVFINWGMAGAVAFLWPIIQDGVGLGWGFFIFAVVVAIGIAYSLLLMPETRSEGNGEGEEAAEGAAETSDQEAAV